MCEVPASVDNGTVSVSADRQTVTYSCDVGWSLDGAAQRQCQTGGLGWTGAPPHCGQLGRIVVLHSICQFIGVYVIVLCCPLSVGPLGHHEDFMSDTMMPNSYGQGHICQSFAHFCTWNL